MFRHPQIDLKEVVYKGIRFLQNLLKTCMCRAKLQCYELKQIKYLTCKLITNLFYTNTLHVFTYFSLKAHKHLCQYYNLHFKGIIPVFSAHVYSIVDQWVLQSTWRSANLQKKKSEK